MVSVRSQGGTEEAPSDLVSRSERGLVYPPGWRDSCLTVDLRLFNHGPFSGPSSDAEAESHVVRSERY